MRNLSFVTRITAALLLALAAVGSTHVAKTAHVEKVAFAAPAVGHSTGAYCPFGPMSCGA